MGNHVIGATLTLRDNMSATLRGVRREQSAFRQDVAATQRILRQQMEVRLNAAAATRTITRVRTAMEPLRSKIVTAVAIRDNATKETRRIRNEMKALGRQAIAPVIRIKDAASSVIGNIVSKLSALKSLAMGLSIGGVGIAAGTTVALKSGSELEQQQIAMKHFIGVSNPGKNDADITKIRDSYIQDLRENANVTPFTTSDVVGAGARAVNIMGGDTKSSMDLVKLSEDMAALNPSKTISDAMEALADAKNGEFERMKEFGFKISADEFKGLVGKKGSDDLTDKETSTAYQMLIDKKLNPFFKGGASEQANSGTGLMSTIKGKLGSKVQDVGLSMLEKLKPTLTTVINLIDKYSPQMDKFGLKIADGIGFAVSKLPSLKHFLTDAFEASRPVINWLSTTGFPMVKNLIIGILEKATSVYDFFKTHWSTLGPFIEGIAIAFVAYKAVMMATEVVTMAVTAAQLALNLAMNLNPMGLVIVGIGLLIGAGIALYQNWETVKTKANEVWVAIENAFKTGVNGAIGLINSLIEKINLIPGVNIPLIADVKMNRTTAQQVEDAKKAGYTDNWAVNGSHANGLNHVPFDGYIAELHKGERIQKASENPYNSSGTLSSRQGSHVVIHMNGTIIREEADVHKIARAIVLELDAVAANM